MLSRLLAALLVALLSPACVADAYSSDPGGSGGDPGDPADPEPPPGEDPPPADFGVVTSPRTGDAIADQALAGAVVVTGLHTRAGEVIEIQALAAPYDRYTSWTTIATTRTGTKPEEGAAVDQPRFPFEVAIDASALWERGGLLALRARAADQDLVGFFADAPICWARWPGWRDRAQHCGNGYVRGGIVLVSTDLDLDAVTAEQIFIDDKGRITPTETEAYYQAIDAPPSLAEFRSRYLQAGEVSAAYYNAGDLGIGREMHCGTYPAAAGPGMACYVSNYGEFGGPRADADRALVDGIAAGDSLGSFAAVAMVYTPPIDAANAVQFIVYGPDQQLASEAVLDTHGDNASIPNNCLECHGNHASYSAELAQVTGARFLPFDPAAFEFVDQAGLRRFEQEEALRQLNQLVLLSSPAHGSVELIDGMYGGRSGQAGQFADTAWAPAGWAGNSAEHVYREVIAPYCRSCHASREAGGTDLLDFTSYDGFAQAAAVMSQVICSSGNERVHRMPSAEVTQRRFWSGPARAYLAAMIDLQSPCTP